MPHLLPSTAEAFFRSVLARTDPSSIPIWRDEIQHHAVGCYSAHSGMKRWNRQAENALMAAEKWSAVALWQTGQPYPDDFRQAWTDVSSTRPDVMAHRETSATTAACSSRRR
jgi:alpha-mannosidase